MSDSVPVGITERDWFAANAPSPTKDKLIFLRNKEVTVHGHSKSEDMVVISAEFTDDEIIEWSAVWRYKWADAMLKARYHSA